MSFEERQAFEDYLNLVAKCMNPDADPRDDFTEYTSGRFKVENFDNKNGEFPPSMYGCTNIFGSILENGQISNATLEKARDFCRSRVACLEGGLMEYLKSDQFNEFCGGVPACNGNWNEANFDWAKAAGILLALHFKTFLSLSMDHLDDTKVIFMSTNEFSYDISNIEEDILKTSGLEDSKLAEIINDLNFVNEICPETFEVEYSRNRGVELQNYIDIFDFKVFLQTALAVEIQDDDIIHFQDGVMDYVSFLSRLNRRVLANYLTAMVMYEHFNEVDDNFFDVNQGRIFRPILISVCFEKYYNEDEDIKYRYTIQMFNQSFEAIRNHFPENVRIIESEALRLNYDQILNYIKENYNSSKICKEYQNLQISPDNFHQNLIRIQNHGIPNSVKKCDSVRGMDQDMKVFMMLFLCSIIVHSNKPLVFHFSGQEATYWRYAIEERNAHLDKNYMDEFQEMLRAQAEEFKELDSLFQPEPIICSIEGIMYAYRDYQKWMKENESTVKWQNEILSRINLDCEKLFFIAFSQHLTCYTYSAKCMVILTLMNCKEFSKCFKCCAESRMNPRKFLL